MGVPAETYRALSARWPLHTSPPQKTQQEHATQWILPWSQNLGFSPVRPLLDLSPRAPIKCATLSLYNRGHVLQKLQGSQSTAGPAEAGAEQAGRRHEADRRTGPFPDQPPCRPGGGPDGGPSCSNPLWTGRQHSALLPEMPWCPRGTSGLSPESKIPSVSRTVNHVHAPPARGGL